MSPPMHTGQRSLTSTEDPPVVQPQQRAWLEIDRDAISHNTAQILRTLKPGCDLMAVIKADGYGHGAVTVAEAASAGGATSFGVATLAEGIELRQAGIAAPILVLGNLQQPEEFRCCQHWDLNPTIIDWREGAGLLEELSKLDGLQLLGTYSHLADADNPDGRLTAEQQQRFEAVLRRCRELELRPGIRHLANSAGTMTDPSLHYDMVRVGLALYGHAPTRHLNDEVDLKPAMAVKARITLLRDVPAGVGISYGHQHITQRPSRLAVLGIGYADGVSRRLSGQMHVLAQGQPLPQVGAITMDQLVVDATDLPDLAIGDAVTLLGRCGEAEISPSSWSELCGTIPWGDGLLQNQIDVQALAGFDDERRHWHASEPTLKLLIL